MDPLAANASAAAILEGYRRALSEDTSPASGVSGGDMTLTDVIEAATERAQGLAPRLPGTGERVDRSA